MAQLVTQNEFRDIAVGTLMTLFLFLFSITIPILGIFSALFLPLPVIFFRSKMGRNSAMKMCFIILFIMVFVSGGVLIGLLLFFELIFLGFMIGEFFEKELSIEKTIGYTSAVVIGSTLFCLFLYSNISHTDIFASVSAIIDESIQVFIRLYKDMGKTEAEISLLTERLQEVKVMVIQVIPAMMICTILFTTWINLIVSKPIFKKRGITYPPFSEPMLWKAPEKFIWILIGSAALLFFPIDHLRVLGANGLMVILLIYFFQGMAIVAFYFEKKNLPHTFRWILYGLIVIALQHLFTFTVIILGIFDMWIDFRKIDAKKQAE